MSDVGVEVWIDGGWGVDALLGKQTRQHKDLDIAIEEKHVALLRDVLLVRGFREVRLEDARPWNFVLGDETGKEIDVHVIVLDDTGNGVYGPPESSRIVDWVRNHRWPKSPVHFSRVGSQISLRL